MIISNLIGIETDFDFNLLFWLDFTFVLWDFKDTLFLYLWIIKLPLYFILIDILDDYSHEFRITSIRFGDNFSFEIDNWWFENKLRFDGIAWDGWRVINSYGFLYSHRNGKLVNSCLFWVEFYLKVINFLWFYYEFKFFVLIFIFLDNLFLLRLTVL